MCYNRHRLFTNDNCHRCSQMAIEAKKMRNSIDTEQRVADFAARVIAACESLPNRVGSQHLQDQLFRSATSVAANYAEACVPESRRDFAHKMGVSLKELVETRIWLRIIAKRRHVKPELLLALMDELEELVKIFHASIKTARRNMAGGIGFMAFEIYEQLWHLRFVNISLAV